MPSYVAKPAPPNQHKRWRQGRQARGLIETLHRVQEAFGYMDEQALRYVAMSLRVPLSSPAVLPPSITPSRWNPREKHTCVICMGTACYINGAPQLLDVVQRDLGIHPGETTADKIVSLLTARCRGSCGLAPAVVYDQEVAGDAVQVPRTALRRPQNDIFRKEIPMTHQLQPFRNCMIPQHLHSP